MQTAFAERVSEVEQFFHEGDDHLGYRRLLDAAIETGNFHVYQKTLAFCDWYDEGEKDRIQLDEKLPGLTTVIREGYREPVSSQPELKLKAAGISMQYASGRFSLSPTDISLRPSEIIGLVGENGNGKTTLLRLLYGELKTKTGDIKYHFSPHPIDFFDTKTRIGFIPQRPQAWYGSLMDNLQYASTYAGYTGEENRLWTEMIIARMGLRPFRNYYWNRISSGYKMRFELARTLIRRPELLLLDEPLANLDMLAQQIILEDLRFLARSHSMPLSIILSSQQLYEVEKVSDRVIFLQNGIAQYQQLSDRSKTEVQPLILEMETTASRDTLEQMLRTHGLEKLSFNGGVYILYFTAGTETGRVLTALGQSGLPIKYFRDISVSSRRFFDA
jgi:ABC-2 type transport system ATP-binding protein